MEAFSTGCSLIYFMYFSLYILLRSIIYTMAVSSILYDSIQDPVNYIQLL